MPVFEYNQQELDALKAKCKTFAPYIDEIGFIQRETIPGLYAALVNSIIGQQIHHRKITRDLFEKYRRRFSPYSSIASLYLWEISVGACGLKDCAPMTEPQKKIKRKQYARKVK